MTMYDVTWWYMKFTRLWDSDIIWWWFDYDLVMIWWFGDVSAMIGWCFGYDFVTFWWCFGDVLLMYWWCFGHVLDPFWNLWGSFWDQVGPNLGPWWSKLAQVGPKLAPKSEKKKGSQDECQTKIEKRGRCDILSRFSETRAGVRRVGGPLKLPNNPPGDSFWKHSNTPHRALGARWWIYAYVYIYI